MVPASTRDVWRVGGSVEDDLGNRGERGGEGGVGEVMVESM